MRPGDERAGVMMMMIIQNNTLLERAQGWEGCELWCHYESRDAASTLYTDHSYVETHSHTDLSLMISLQYSENCSPGPSHLRPLFPVSQSSLIFPGGIPTPRHAPAHGGWWKYFAGQRCDTWLTDLRYLESSTKTRGRDGNKTLSFSRGKPWEGGQFRRQAPCLSSSSSINIMRLARNIWIIVRHWGRPLSTWDSNVTVRVHETRSWQFRIFRMSLEWVKGWEEGDCDCYLRRLLHCGSQRDPSPRHHYEIPKTFG